MEDLVGRSLQRFHGGIKLRHWKKLSIGPSLEFAGIPERLILPLNQHLGDAAKPIVTAGEQVLKGQRIAVGEGRFSAHLHAPTSGTVTAIEARPIVHPANLNAPCIVLQADGRDESVAAAPHQNWQEMTPEALVQMVEDAGIVGLGGALFPTAVKMRGCPPPATELLLINGAECEPYIACDESLMRHRPREFLIGCQILARAVSARQVVIAVEDQMGATEHILNEACRENGFTDIAIIKVLTIYPEGGEDQLIKALTGREVPSKGTPLDLGILCQNVGTAYAVHEAIVAGQPLISRIVSITGRGIKQPRSLQALIGTPLSFLIEQAGGYTEDIRRLLVGGPMMGIAVASDDRPLSKAGNCVLGLIDRDIETTVPELPCIRCMECVRVCPAQLLPQQLLLHIKAGDFDQVEEHSLDDCIECGCCAYACPSQIPLVDYYRYGKAEIRARQQQRQQADHARQRFEQRELRLTADQAARKARLAARAPANNDSMQDAVAAAVARAKARRHNKDEES